MAAPGAVCPPQWAMAALLVIRGGVSHLKQKEVKTEKRKKKMQGAVDPPMVGDSLPGCSVSTSVGDCCTFLMMKGDGCHFS